MRCSGRIISYPGALPLTNFPPLHLLELEEGPNHQGTRNQVVNDIPIINVVKVIESLLEPAHGIK